MPRQIIFFLVDTQGANCVGSYVGTNELHTANLDRLASKGIRFERAYTCSPVCGPARSAIFTGLYPHSNGVLGNDMAPHADLPSVGQRLHDVGIHTAYIGKWHLDGSDYFGDGRCPPGWDAKYWFDGRNYLDSLPDDAARDLSRRVLDAREVSRHGITAHFTHAHGIADRARAFVERHKDEDFFLVVSIDEPHHPFICPEPFVSSFDDCTIRVPNAKDTLLNKPRSQNEWADQVAPLNAKHVIEVDEESRYRAPRYFACNSFCDFEIGRVMEAVDAHVPQALVVHTADHGDMLGGHRLNGKGPAMYEEVARVPLIVRWPGVAPLGSVSSALASHIDLVPTFLQYFGLDVPALLHGRSLLSQFRRPETSAAEAIFLEFHRFEVDHDGFGAFAPIRCVFDGRYKLAINLLDTDELYDLEMDPHEMTNLIEDPAASKIRDQLHDRVLDWMNRTRDPLRGPHWGRRPWRAWDQSTWHGPTRPRPFDQAYFPKTLLYETGHIANHPYYNKS